jgi:hypothetical protein
MRCNPLWRAFFGYGALDSCGRNRRGLAAEYAFLFIQNEKFGDYGDN